MSTRETADTEIALPEIDVSAIYEEVQVNEQPILVTPLTRDLSHILDHMRSAADWARTNLKRSVTVFLLVLVGAELIARTAEPRLVNRIYDESTTAGYPLSLNRDGYRGPLVDPDNAQGHFRILALGDSVTFGTGVPVESTWPMRLADRISSGGTRQVEAINLSGPAADLTQLSNLLADYANRVAPDVVVLMLTGNMVSLGWIRQGDEPLPLLRPPNGAGPSASDQLALSIKRIPHAFAVPGVLTFGMEYFRFAMGMSNHLVDPEAPYGVMLAHGIRQNTLPPSTAIEAWALVKHRLQAIQRVARDLDLPLVVAYAPPRFTFSDRRTDNMKFVPVERFTIDPFDRADAICTELGIPLVRIEQALRQASVTSEELYVLGDYTHFDRAGHEVIADVVETELRRISRLDLASLHE